VVLLANRESGQQQVLETCRGPTDDGRQPTAVAVIAEDRLAPIAPDVEW
jgi:hypothetical protein